MYDGYSWWPLVTGLTEATSFSHLHNYEPHRFNNVVPQHGILSTLYHKYLQRSLVSFGTKYSGMKKNSGPPYYRIGKKWPPMENNSSYQRFKEIKYEVWSLIIPSFFTNLLTFFLRLLLSLLSFLNFLLKPLTSIETNWRRYTLPWDRPLCYLSLLLGAHTL